MKIAYGSSLITLGLALLANGCSSDSKGSTAAEGGAGSTTEDVTVEVFSWWTAPGEAEALQALVDLHTEKFPNERIYNAATDQKLISGGQEAKKVLEDRMKADDPPDAFQTNAFELKRGYLSETKGILAPLDDFYKSEKLVAALPPESLDDITVGGHRMAVPVNIHRENGLFYNKTVFKDNGIKPPTTMDEFLAACEKLKAAGVTPLAISTSQNWIIDKVFVALAAGTLGEADFVKYFKDKEPIDADTIAPVVDVLDKVLTDYIDVEAAAADGYGWTQCADDLMSGKTAMFIHGDWAKGYLVQQGATPNVDFGVVANPGANGVVVYGMDVFAIPSGAKHPEAALDWLRTISSAEGQVAFNNFKGSSPVFLNVPDDDLDPMAKTIYADFKNATSRVPAPGIPQPWDDAMGELAKKHDKQALIDVIVANPFGT